MKLALIMASEYGNLGTIYNTRGDLEQAYEYWRKALALYEEIGARPMIEQLQSLLDEICSG